jgi:hypothetical protein
MSGFKLSNDSSSATDHPLVLTVHSMPQPSEPVQGTVRRGAGRLKMLAVLLVCAAPVVASYLTYYVIKPESRQNFGELITPARALPNVTGVDLDGTPVNLQTLKGQWLLLSVASARCDEACVQQLYLQRQMRESLGREKDRLDWVWLISDDAPVAEPLRSALKGATILRVPAGDIAAWLAPGQGHTLAEHLYLVDPLGNWMLRFPAGLDKVMAAKAKRDIERVLRAANSWDKAGRVPTP